MNEQESYPEAAALLADAGWAPHDTWGVFTRGTLVMGRTPDGRSFHIKDWAKVPPGHPLHSFDTPDTPEEAAAWLVATFTNGAPIVPMALNPLASEATLDAPVIVVETAGHERDSEIGAEAGAAEATPGVVYTGGSEGRSEQVDHGDQSGGDVSPSKDVAEDPIDADFTESDEAYIKRISQQTPDSFDFDDLEPTADLSVLEFHEEMAEAEEQAGGSQFIFGDNLDQKRTAAIGLVMRYARSITPHWDETADRQLAQMRNFAMGVSEGRWPDDQALREDLDTLEATLRLIHAIEAVTRDKVAFLEAAGREEIEAFVVEFGWP